jgi:hypothetical protein
MRLPLTIALALAVPMFASGSAAPAPTVAMSTMSAEGGIGKKIQFPRLTKLPNAKVMAKINATLAKKEAEERQGAAECVANVKDAGQKPSDASYDISVAVTYLSTKYLSLTDQVAYDCAGAHPDSTEAVLTFDLATGAEVDLMNAFKPGFDFAKIYASHYRMPKAKDDDADCRGWSTGDAGGLGELRPHLDAKIGIVISLEAAHVVAACADDFNMSVADLQKYLKDQALLADLKANVKTK